MKRLLILGGGTAGTMVANRLVHELDMAEWHITVVDQDETHYYQPGFLFIPFGTYGKADVMRPKRDYLPRAIPTETLALMRAVKAQFDPFGILNPGKVLPAL